MRLILILSVIWAVCDIYKYIKGYPTEIGAWYEICTGMMEQTTPTPQELPEIPVEEMAGSVKNEVEVKEETSTSVSEEGVSVEKEEVVEEKEISPSTKSTQVVQVKVEDSKAPEVKKELSFFWKCYIVIGALVLLYLSN